MSEVKDLLRQRIEVLKDKKKQMDIDKSVDYSAKIKEYEDAMELVK
jgi:hypothetical protein